MIAILLSPDDADVDRFEVSEARPTIETAVLRPWREVMDDPNPAALMHRRVRWVLNAVESELMSIAHEHQVLVYRQRNP